MKMTALENTEAVEISSQVYKLLVCQTSHFKSSVNIQYFTIMFNTWTTNIFKIRFQFYQAERRM